MNYFPDNWVVIQLKGDDPHYRVLAGWSGGYGQGDSWQLNSGITRIEENEHSFSFHGASGSCYVCQKHSYGLRMNNAYVWDDLKRIHGDLVELMDEDTDWNSIDWKIKEKS